MESGGAQTIAWAAAAAAPRRATTLDNDDGPPVEEKRRRTESDGGGARAVASSIPPWRRVIFDANMVPVDGIPRAEILPGFKHRDGSIYRRTDYMSKLFHLDDTRETYIEPMMMTKPLTYCSPNWWACDRHRYRPMMQIFSLKLVYPPSSASDPVQLYGFLAVRDRLDPLRNYIFNRTRDDPFIVGQDGSIQMSGPKRGILWEDMALIEFDMKIKRGEEEGDDLQLIDGAVYFNDSTSTHAKVNSKRIDGDYGSVVMRFALLQCSVEATVQVGVSGLEHGSGLNLGVAAFYICGYLNQEIQLFDGVIPATAERYELNRWVVAAMFPSKLAIKLRISQTSGSDHDVLHQFCLVPVRFHGTEMYSYELGFATIDVKTSWSTLDIPKSSLTRKSLLV